MGFNIKKYFKEEDLYRDRESQIKAIENTFDSAKISVCTTTMHYYTLRRMVVSELLCIRDVSFCNHLYIIVHSVKKMGESPVYVLDHNVHM